MAIKLTTERAFLNKKNFTNFPDFYWYCLPLDSLGKLVAIIIAWYVTTKLQSNNQPHVSPKKVEFFVLLQRSNKSLQELVSVPIYTSMCLSILWLNWLERGRLLNRPNVTTSITSHGAANTFFPDCCQKRTHSLLITSINFAWSTPRGFTYISCLITLLFSPHIYSHHRSLSGKDYVWGLLAPSKM